MIRLREIAEGHRFQVPGVPASALVVRVIDGIHVSYFFPFLLEDHSDCELKSSDAVLIAAHGLQGMPRQLPGWTMEPFRRQDWPLPIWVYSTKAGFGPCKADLQMVFRGALMPMDATPLDPGSVNYPTADYGLSHFENVRKRLTAILESGDVSAGRVYKLDRYRPDGGELFTNPRS